jgi:hypothetical protein
MDGKENDEGENLLANITLKKSAAGKPANMSMILYYQDKTKPETTPGSADLSDHILSALNGAKGILVEKLLGKNSDWNLRLWFGDRYEAAEMSFPLSRSFANVHLSGKSTGGVCFGSFSKAEENKPLFQCYYPSEFEYGIRGVTNYFPGEVETGGRWYDSKTDATDNWDDPAKGKMIYRQTFVAKAGSASSAATMGTIENFGALVGIHGSAYRESTKVWYNVPAYSDNGVWNDVYIASDGTVRARSSFGSDVTFYITVDYMKKS